MNFPFAGQTGRGIKVAVVDSGIVSNHPKIGQVAGGIALAMGPDGTILYGEDHADCAGHGTACAGIIRRKAPEAELYSVRIFDESLQADSRLLIAAIEWALDQGMDLINLSLGTTEVTYRDALEQVCRQAVDQGVLLVAAEHEEGQESYPAHLPQVIGVGSGKVRGLYKYLYRQEETIECIARGDAQRLCWLEPSEIMTAGTSFAAPHITGLVALIRETHPKADLEQVRQLLHTHAQPEAAPRSAPKPVALPEAEESFSWIQKAALYPYNKEMHALMRGRDLLSFEIVGIGDPIGKGLTGKDAGKAIGLPPVGFQVAPRLAAALQGADTLILGYVDELSRIRKKDVLREAVQMALDQGVHVFSLLALPRERYADLYEQAETKGLRLYYPALSAKDAQQTLASASQYPQVDVPVVAVLGTSSQQGKFTLQLALRRRLLELGYRVGQIGTEHHAALFGMDATFPMGYAASVEMPLDYYAPYLDAKMRQICHRKRPHLILAGSQSGTVPYNVSEPENHTLSTIAFLMGVKPDACLLVVNSIDTDDYIQDTIDGIRAVCHAPTLLLAMSDKEKHVREAYGRTSIKPRPMSEEDSHRKLRLLEQKFKLPTLSMASQADFHKAV
ncbi:MAG: S8 family serine peptidase [Gemmatimonadetes bacterium]|nr:S8 family serine peptidase [Gemmatimonadota bacterium]